MAVRGLRRRDYAEQSSNNTVTETPEQQIQKLRAVIRGHDHTYYVKGQPTVSDAVYDGLMQVLRTLERASPHLITPDSPTQRVCESITSGSEGIPHKVPMLSLDNVVTPEELQKFIAGLAAAQNGEPVYVNIEPKIDGLAVAVIYENGRLVRAVTRGDGRTGEDVTAQVRTIRSVPLALPDNQCFSFEARGEVYMPKAAFDRINQELASRGEKLFANPRNAAVGALKSKDPAVTRERGLDMIFYELGAPGNFPMCRTHTEVLQVFTSLGLVNVASLAGNVGVGWSWEEGDPARIAGAVLQGLPAYMQELPFQTDGAVIKVTQLGLRRELGFTGKAPNWAVAYKYPPKQEQSMVLAVDVQVGRTGALTPVARLKPTLVSGSVVSNATLHNFDEIARKDVRIGDQVLLIKCGEIIPAVDQVLKDLRSGAEIPVPVPTHCPRCGTPVRREEGMKKLYCPNVGGCPAIAFARLKHFVAKDVMNIEGVGPEFLLELTEAGILRDPADLYSLTRERLLARWPSSHLSVGSALRAIAASKDRPADKVLVALGIPNIGNTLAPVMISHFGGILEFLQAACHNPDALTAMDGMGEVKTAGVQAWAQEPQNRQLVEKLQAAGLKFHNDAGAALVLSKKLEGTVWCITGELSRERGKMEDLIRAHGGAAKSSVTKAVTHLMVGEEPGKSKIAKAKESGGRVQICDEVAFWRLLQ